MNNRTLYILVIAAVLLASGLSYWYGKQTSSTQVNASTGTERKVLYWYDPMNPVQHFDKPGKSPFMDMQLVPRYQDEEGARPNDGVRIDPRIAQNLGVRLSTVEQGVLNSTLDVDGTMMFNQRDVSILQSRTNGFVTRVYPYAPGDVIDKDQPLVDVLVPEWASAQAEYLALLKSGEVALVNAAQTRLRLLGMPDELIARLQATQQVNNTITIRSPRSGMINSLEARDGMTLGMGAPLATIYGLQTVWMEVAIPESQATRVAVNQTATADVAAFPNVVFKGKVIAIVPETNVETHTLRARVELDNARQRLRPGMFARVHLPSSAAESVLLVPSEAIIHTGKRALVLVAQADSRYVPTEIVVGTEAAGKTSVLSGLEAGQQVVSSGQFLIDSEANLNGVLNRLNSDMTSPTKDNHAEGRSP